MQLFGRRWDRWDGIVAAAAVTLIVVSNQPWWADGVVGSGRSTTLALVVGPVNIWTAWGPSHWSEAVVLAMLAAGVHLAYQGRPEARGAAWLAVVLLLGGLGLIGWQWHRTSNAEVVVVKVITRYEDPGQRLPIDGAEEPVLYRSDPQWGLYAGAGSLIVMFAAIARGLVPSRPTRASAG